MSEQPKWLEVNPHGIPDELKELPQWVVWAFEPRAPGEEPTKIPYSAKGLPRRAKANDPRTWGRFDHAMKIYREGTGIDGSQQHSDFVGIGFEFAAGGGLVGIDLDKCRDPESGELAEWAADVVKRFNTYAEVSPSRTGVKLWCRGKLPVDGKGKKRAYQSGAVEMYGSGRYFAVTGHAIESSPETIREAQTEIEWLWSTVFAAATRKPKPETNSGSDVVRRAKKYLAKLPPAIAGQGGHNATFNAACAMVLGFDLRPDQAYHLLLQYNERCEPPWSEDELKHKLRDALAKKDEGAECGYLLNAKPARARRSPPPAETTKKEAGGDDRRQIRNWERKGKGDEAKYFPLPMTQVLTTIRGATGDWPRRVGQWLFVHEAENEVSWLQKTTATFGYLQSKTGLVPWRTGVAYVTQEQVYEELRRTATGYSAVELFPHWPTMPGHYYACETPGAGDGKALNALLDRFRPSTPIDRELFEALFVTPGWGGPGGCRPAFLITSPAGGRGAGKSKNASMVGHLWGGAVDFKAQEDVVTMKERLLSPDGLRTRVAMLDNIKSLRFSWPELEAIITTPMISGKRMYVGEGARPNTITWLLTLNGASLSTDMAQRVIPIQIDRPDRTGNWEEDTIAFINDNRAALLADVAAFYRRRQRFPQRYSRWAAWERDVLSRLRDPDAVQRAILERQEVADVEAEEADILREYFAERLADLGYDIDSVKVHIPRPVACAWWNAVYNDRKSTGGVTRLLKQAISEGRIKWLAVNACESYGRGYLWCGEDTNGTEAVAYDIGDRLANAKGGYSRAVWE